jgi:hypothetical protein
MTEWRRHTGTKTLQTFWTVFVVVAVVVFEITLPELVSRPVAVVGGGAVWLLGLLGLGLYGRYHWRRLVGNSSLEPGRGPDTADLQGIRHGQSVSVVSEVPGLLSQVHTTVRANVEGVEATFTVGIRDAGSADPESGLTTGDDALDNRFAIEGSAENVRVLLTDEVRTRLLDVETPGTITATGETVVCEIPFDRLTPEELDAAVETVAVIAARIEAVDRE